MKVVVFGQALIHEPVCWPDDLRALASGASAVICNFEGCLPPARSWPMKRKTVHAAHPDAPSMLRELGVTHLSIANNHVWDFGHAGIMSTRAACVRAGFAVAGAGANPAEAAAPAQAGGVALIAVDAGPTPDWAIAGSGPGVATLRVTRSLGLADEDRRALRRIALRSGDTERADRRHAIGYDATEPDDQFWGVPVVAADRTGEIWSVDQADLDRLALTLSRARQTCDVTIVSVHYHHWSTDWSKPPRWLLDAGATLTDLGADGVIATGPPFAYPLVVSGAQMLAPGLGNLVFHTRRAERYDAQDLPVWKGMGVVLDDGQWSSHAIDVVRPTG